MGAVYLGKKFLRHMNRGGLRAAAGAMLLYCGRRLNRSLNLHNLDDYLRIDSGGSRPSVPATTSRSLEDLEYVGKELRRFHVDSEDIQLTHEINRQWRRAPSEIKRALWLMPDFISVHNGGPNTILRHAHFLADQGIHNTIVINDGVVHTSSEDIAGKVAKVFGNNPNVQFVLNPPGKPLHPELLPDSDICFATLWYSAYILSKYHRTKAKFYLIQDYESHFYPANMEFALADQTYKMGFLGLFNTPGLAEAIRHDHPVEGKAFIPGVDADVFYPPQNRPKSDYKKIFFYGRPEVPRNGYELGIAGLVEIQAKYPDVEVFIAGHHEAYRTSGLRAHFLPYQDYRCTGNLYRSCDFVFGFMFTPHPSYIPLQAMACGTIPICVDNPYIRWIIRHRKNAMAVRPSPQAVCEAYAYLRDNPEQRRRMRETAIAAAPFQSWERVMAENYAWIREGAPNQLDNIYDSQLLVNGEAA